MVIHRVLCNGWIDRLIKNLRSESSHIRGLPGGKFYKPPRSQRIAKAGIVNSYVILFRRPRNSVRQHINCRSVRPPLCKTLRVLCVLPCGLINLYAGIRKATVYATILWARQAIEFVAKNSGRQMHELPRIKLCDSRCMPRKTIPTFTSIIVTEFAR